ncbi:MAG: trehalose-phosphatase [Variibacter sp.]
MSETARALPEAQPVRAASAQPPVFEHPDPKTIAVLLDVDGTLIELAATPQAVHVPPSLKHTLAVLRDLLGGALALVSGRPLADLDNIFDPLRVALVGGHGAETRLRPRGEVERTRIPPMDDRLRRRLIAIAAGTEGVLAEDKGYSLALHYRLAPQAERYVHDEILRACAAFPDVPAEVLPGKSMFEVKPPAFNKGMAVRELMRKEPFAGRRPIFLGDDVTDESVFAVLPEFDGIGYSVGRRFPNTKGVFATPREVRHWLYGFIKPRERAGT